MKKRLLLSYSTKHLAKKDKVRFFYALNGRNDMLGIIPRTQSERLGRTVLLVKPEHLGDFQEFMEYWECTYRELQIWLK